MSSYNRLKLSMSSIALALVFNGCSYLNTPLKNSHTKEDLNILLALDSEKTMNFKDSYKYYTNLYNLTSKEIYLNRAIGYGFKINNYDQLETLIEEGIDKFPQNKIKYQYQYILTLTLQEKYEKALKIAHKLLQHDPSSNSYEMVANVYYSMKNYHEAIKYYESAYVKNQNETTLIKLTNILYNYLDQKKTALAYLETYLQTNECTLKICNKLMLIYQEQGDVDGMLSILTKMYTAYKDKLEHSKTTLFIQKLIISLLEKKDINEAIKFLEDTKLDQSRLINLYYQNKQLDKALDLTKELYNTTKNPALLGKMAMYEFELSDNKRVVLDSVMKHFDLALSSGINNPVFQNYYGYLLIDYDINIKKGIDLVKKALKTTPNNIAYLDSLAWGYYKIKDCEKAYEVMSKIMKLTSTKDPEILLHWNRIKDCKIKLKKDKTQK